MNKKSLILTNFKEVFTKKTYMTISIVTAITIGTIFYFFTNSAIIKGNYGLTYHYTQVFFQILITILFSIFLPISIYKYLKFSSFNIKENSASAIGTFFGIIVAGCPACSITIASYIGLAGIISLLPYHGLELKIIAIPMLLYANYSILKNLNGCNINHKKEKKKKY